MIQKDRDWFLTENGELDPNKILDTTPPRNETAERYKQLMLAGVDTFGVSGNTINTARVKVYKEIHATLSNVLDATSPRHFIETTCPLLLSIPVGEIGTEAAQAMARICIEAHAKEAEQERARAEHFSDLLLKTINNQE